MSDITANLAPWFDFFLCLVFGMFFRHIFVYSTRETSRRKANQNSSDNAWIEIAHNSIARHVSNVEQSPSH